MRFSQFLIRGALCLAAFAGLVGAQSLVLLPGSQGTNTSIPVYTPNPLGPLTTIGGVPAGASQLLALPNGTKYYVITNSSGITVLDRNLANARQILTSLNAAPSLAAISPDGRRLFVIAGNIAYLIDTATDGIAGSALNVTGTPVDVAFSLDSQTAFILSTQTFTGSFVTPVDLPTNSIGTTVTLPGTGAATGIATAPSGLLYVSAPNGIFEINPKTLLLTAGSGGASTPTIAVQGGTPGKLQFSSDAQTAVALNRNSATGAAIIFNLANRTATLASGAGVIGNLDQLLVASDSRIFVHSTANQMYELSLGGGFTQSPILVGLPQGAQITSIAPSTEAQARTLFVTATANGTTSLYNINLASNTLQSQTLIPNQFGQSLVFAAPNPTSGGISVQGIGVNQTIAAGAVSRPLVARVLDANGLPVFGTTVNFTVVNGGLTLSSQSASTNSNGYAQVYATALNSAGTYQVQAGVAGAVLQATYNVTVSGGGTGGGNPGGCTQNCVGSGLFILSGNGQLITENTQGVQLLLVAVRDGNGNPLPGQTVTFTASGFNGLPAGGSLFCTGIGDPFQPLPSGTCSPTIDPTTGLGSGISMVTDNNGLAGVKFVGSSTNGPAFVQTNVTATSTAGTQTFTIVTQKTGLGQTINAYLLAPAADSSGRLVISGTAGQTLPQAIQFQVGSLLPGASNVSGIGLNLINLGDPKTTPTASCAGGTPLSDASGLVSCNIVLGPVPGTAVLRLNIGGAIESNPITIIVAPGSPGKINIVSGNNQSANVGQQLVLRAQVTDATGVAAANVPVTFAVVQGNGAISGASSQSDSSGNVQANLTLNAVGTIAVQLTAGSGSTAATARFTVTANNPITIGAITAVSGGGQIAVVGTPFGAPVVVRVTDQNGQPVQGVPVTFSVTAGGASVGSATVITDAQGNASTSVSAGAGQGTITVQASSGNQLTQFTLTARVPGPGIVPGSFRNAASGAAGLTPCGIAIVSGAGLATNVQGTNAANQFVGPLPYQLSGVMISVNGIPAPIYWVSNTQQGGEAVAFQTPCEVTPGPASVVVTVSGGSTTVANVPVFKYQPGIFDTALPNGRRQAVLLHVSDGSYVTPDNPARRGEQLKMFVTGLGLGATPTGTNRAGIGGQASDALITVGVNNAGVRVIGSEYLPGEVGIYTITFEVPTDTATGTNQNLGFVISDPSDPTNTAIYALGSFLPII